MTYRFLTMAIHLNSRGLAFVVFEGELAPLDWSVIEVRGSDKREKLLGRVETLFAKLQPNILVLENMSAFESRPQRIRSLNDAIVQLAHRYALPTVYFTRTEARQRFAYLGTVTKGALAMAIAKHIPAFERFLPRARKPWQSEDARMGIFDAAALALTFYHTPPTGGPLSF